MQEVPALSLKQPRSLRRRGFIGKKDEVLLDIIEDGVVEVDHELSVVWMNRAGLEILHVPRVDCQGMKVYDLFQTDREFLRSRIEAILDGSELGNDPIIVRSGPTTIKVRVGSRSSRNGGAALLVFSDITELLVREEQLKETREELKRVEAQLLQSCKLSSLGHLTANITHEINTPLTSILGYVSMLRANTEEGDPAREDLGIVQAEALRARRIVRGLLGFLHPGESLNREVNIGSVLDETLLLVGGRAKSLGVRVVNTYEGNLPPINADDDQIQLVFLNIINNAFDAMPHGGTLTIRSVRERHGLTVCFEDTGIGVPAHLIGRLTEPFFTTKPENEGTGLGLSVSRTIVERFGGSLDIRSEDGKGSCFALRFPIGDGG